MCAVQTVISFPITEAVTPADVPIASAQSTSGENSEDDEPAPKSARRRQSCPVTHSFLFGVIFSRCRDVSATVRAKALQTLADITAANNKTMAKVISNIFQDTAHE